MTATQNRHIFVSVGSRFTMDRLLLCVEKVVQKNPHLRGFAQIGNSEFLSPYLKTSQWVKGAEFNQAVKNCDIFVSHAGMGNILLAAQYNKPIIIMSRRADLNEHINDHQISTASAFSEKLSISVAKNTAELEQAILQTLDKLDSKIQYQVGSNSSKTELINSLKKFIDEH